MTTHTIEFTSKELDMLDTALMSSAIRFGELARNNDQNQWINNAWRDGSNDLWLKVYNARRHAGLVVDPTVKEPV
jgi:hypothetical protein